MFLRVYDAQGALKNTSANFTDAEIKTKYENNADTNEFSDAEQANLVTLSDDSIADSLHRHSELVASDGSPDPAWSVDAAGALSGSYSLTAKYLVATGSPGDIPSATALTYSSTAGRLFAWSSVIGTAANIVLRGMSSDGSVFHQHIFSQSGFSTAGGIEVGSPTGGNKGAGTINAVAVYDDNVLLTCYPFDQKLDGKISQRKWDKLVPDRRYEAVIEEQEEKDKDGNLVVKNVEVKAAYTEKRTHKPAAKFKERIGTKYDPMDIDKYARHWKEKRHLTAMPNEVGYDPDNNGSGKLDIGNWVQRLIETVEIQAIHIETLNQRLKAVEN